MNDIFNGAKNLGFGMMRLPSLDPEDPGKIDFEQAQKMVDKFMERGFTYFDTALMYCNSKSERAVKTLLTDRYPREAFTVATKLHSMYLRNEGDPDSLFAKQQERTGLEYFDYYLIHDINSHSINKYNKFGVFEWLKAKKAAGLVKHIGFSFHDSPELLDQILTEHPEMEFCQIQLNYLDYNNPAIRSRECYEVAAKHNKPVIIMEPVKGGTLVNVPQEVTELFKSHDPNMSVASWAVRFAASHDNVRMVLSGMTTEPQLEDNTSFMQNFKPLTDEEKQMVMKAADIINASTAIPCTGCSYCTEGCPKHIAIPKYFALYNAELKEDPDNKKPWTPQKEYYVNVAKHFGKASDCIFCGQCEGVCPQHLHVTEYLKDVKVRFEQ